LLRRDNTCNYVCKDSTNADANRIPFQYLTGTTACSLSVRTKHFMQFCIASPVGVMCATTYREGTSVRRSSRTSSTSSETSCRSLDSLEAGHTELSETSQAVFWDSDLNSGVRCRCSQKGHGRRNYAGLRLHQAHCHVLIATWPPAIEDLLLLGRTYSRWSSHRANRLVQASNRQQANTR
jgi:hypothetical protein